MNAFELLIGGLPVAALVLLTVQALKVFGFVSGETAPRAAILTALVFGAASAVARLVPTAAEYIVLFAEVFAGALVAGLGYEYVANPLLERFGINVSATDLK